MKRKYKVLIADGDEEISCMLKNHLDREIYEVETAHNAIDALEKVKNDKYHIVLIDADVPEMDEIELLKEVKCYDALTQVIMTAEQSTMEKILSSLEYGANDYIQKPFNSVEHVIQVIEYSVQKLERWRECIIQIVSLQDAL